MSRWKQYSGIWTSTQQAQARAAETWTGLPQYELYGAGSNASGSLGLNNTNSQSSPTQVGYPPTWGNVSFVRSAQGREYTFAILENGTLWAWGINTDGQLGLGTQITMSSPVQVGALTNWKEVGAGYANAVAVKTDGTLWSWGRGANGFVGDGTVVSKSSPVQLGSLTTWDKISVAQNGAFAVKTDNTLWGWGYNDGGLIGKNNRQNYSSPVQIGGAIWLDTIGGYDSAYAISTSNTLYAWGQNNGGALGTNESFTLRRSSPVQVGALTNWASGVAGFNCAAFLKTNNTLWTWGDNISGQNGQNVAPADSSSPTQVGALTDWSLLGAFYNGFSAIKTDGSLWVWGGDNDGQLGQSTRNVNISSPTQVGSETNWVTLSESGKYNFFATKLTKTTT